MKICNVCLKSDIMCSGCTKKLETKQITKPDIDLSRALFKLGMETDFVRAYDFDKSVFVVVNKKNAGLLIGHGGKNAKRIGAMLGKDLRVIENTDDEKKFIESITGFQVIGINKVYGANESYKVRVERKYRYRTSTFPSIVSKIINKPVQFVFE